MISAHPVGPSIIKCQIQYITVTGSCAWTEDTCTVVGVTVLLQVHHNNYYITLKNTNIKINTFKQLQNQYNIQLWLQNIYIHLTHINLSRIHHCITTINASMHQNPRPQTPQEQPVTKPETPLQNIQVRSVNTMKRSSTATSSISYTQRWLEVRNSRLMYVIADILV